MASGLVVMLVAGGALIAFVTEPTPRWGHHMVRAVVIALAFVMRRLAMRRVARGRGVVMAQLLALVVAVDLEVMVIHSGGAASPYSTGFCLLTATLGLLFPFNAREAAIAAATATAIYVVPLLPGGLRLETAILPFFFVLAGTAVGVSAAHHRSLVHRREFDTQADLEEERGRSEKLLANILPESIVERLKRSQVSLAEGFAEVTILFADIVGFTRLASQISPEALVELLNAVFSEFDDLVDELGLEKIKTIGDAYMVVGGLPVPREDHAEAVAELALRMQEAIGRHRLPDGSAIRIRAGINSGPVVAGVIGHRKFIYDLWGDAVNTASRMESHGEPGLVQVTEATFHRLKDAFDLEERGLIHVKGKGEMRTYFLRGRRGGDLG